MVSFNPNATVPVSQETLGLVQQMKESSNEEVQSLGALADSLTSTGELTETQKTILAATAQLQLSDPTLTGPDRDLVQQFADSIASMPVVPGSGPMMPIANSWLNVTAFVTVIKMIFEITAELSQIKLSEAQLQIIMTKVNAEMAQNIAQMTEAAGQLQAEMRMNEAYKALVQAGTALATMALTAFTTVARSVMLANKIADWQRTEGTMPSLDKQLALSQQVDAELMMLKSLQEALPQAINALASASTEARNAALEILKAEAEAASGKLSKLAELLKGTIDTLRGDQSDLSQTIAKLLDNFLTAFSRQRLGNNG